MLTRLANGGRVSRQLEPAVRRHTFAQAIKNPPKRAFTDQCQRPVGCHPSYGHVIHDPEHVLCCRNGARLRRGRGHHQSEPAHRRV